MRTPTHPLATWFWKQLLLPTGNRKIWSKNAPPHGPYSGDMRVRHRRQQPEKNSPATTKRKHSSISEQSREDDTKAKKRTLAHRRKETITLQPDPYPTLNCSNKFEPIRCCSSSFRGHKGLKKKKSRPIDGFRQWVFSSRDFSYRKGIWFSMETHSEVWTVLYLHYL